MNSCAEITALLGVYLDDETTPDTNALVLQHVAACEACASHLHAQREQRHQLRTALQQEGAPAALHGRVRALLVPARPSMAAFIRSWIIPAAATALVAWIVIPWRPAEPEIYAMNAVAEHRACALDRAMRPRDVSFYTAEAWMPLIPDLGGRIRVVEAHACGQQTDFTHVIVEDESAHKASILIMRSGEGAARTLRPERRGDFEVTQLRTTWHRAFVVIDRTRAPALREWREPALQRVQQFLKQTEGT